MDLISLFIKGSILMWPILACSIIGTAIIIEKLIVLRKTRLNIPSFLIRIRSMLKKKDVHGAIAFCMETKTPIANIIRKGLKKYKFGHQRVVEAIDSAGRQEITKLEKGLSTLATIAGIAPLIGFLGTVTGMITAFMTVQELQGAAGPSDLAGGIWEALVTTAFGLFVGIPALAFYNFLLSKINKIVVDMELVANDVLDVLEEGGIVKTDDDIEEVEF
jgi:biopolymer transport protein ExbB